MSGQPQQSPTALVALIDAAESVVGRWRADLDPSARLGMPAHVTILYPWIPLVSSPPKTRATWRL